MRICFFSAQYLPTVGGVERYTYNLAKQIIAAGHEALVVTSALPGLPAHEIGSDGIEIYRLPALLFMKGRFPVPLPCPSFHTLAKQLWKTPIDLCLIQTRFYVSSLYAARQCSKRNIPSIVVDHSTGHLPMGSSLLNWAGARYEHFAAWYLQRYCTHYFGVSKAVSQWLGHFGIKAQGQLYNAVDPSAIRSIAHAEAAVDWRQRLGLCPETHLIASLGRLIPEKGVPQLIEAFQKAKLEGCALIVAGDGPLMSKLKENCPDKVYLVGSIAYPQALQLLQQAQVYCLPTFYAEGFPTTFLEAAACGCPIITTHTGGSGELLPDSSYGLQLEGPDPDALAQALSFALSNPSWRVQAAQKTGQLLEQNFTWEAVSQHLLKIAKELASR